MKSLSSECEHSRLEVTWGDDRAYWEKTKILALKDGTHQVENNGEWKMRDSGGGEEDDTHQWLISILCEDCGYWLVEDCVTRATNPNEVTIINKIVGMKP